ncbi:MAG: hypothetical protein CMK59_06880 [Proteobacteria bacterium]|nr:hypothetical protein [Pseudomonadota bacterium]
MDVFRVRNGAMIDLPALEAIAHLPHHLLTSYLATTAPGMNGLILNGLEPEGQRPRNSGPPGIMRFPIDRITLSAGVAILPLSSGQLVTVRFNEPQTVITGASEKSKTTRALVLTLNERESYDRNSRLRASDEIEPQFQLMPLIEAKEIECIQIAYELAPKIWTTDICRLWQPSHHAIGMVLRHFDELEELIWNCDNHGEPWKKQSLGREWKTYQTKASVAVTSARITLAGRASTSMDRVRLLTNLHWQLQRSIEQAASKLEQWMGVPETAGVYAPLFSAYPEEWDQIF